MTQPKFKEGDWAFSLKWGWGKIRIEIKEGSLWPIVHYDENYLPSGKKASNHKCPELFTVSEAAYHNFPPPPKEKVKKTIEGWVNIYPGGHASDIFFAKESHANRNAMEGRIACVRVSGEYFCDE